MSERQRVEAARRCRTPGHVPRTLYIGSTIDLAQRLKQHEAGMGAEYTKRRLPVSLFWCGEFDGIDEAFAWEKRLQGWSHTKRVAFAEGGLDAVIGWQARQRREKRAASTR